MWGKAPPPENLGSILSWWHNKWHNSTPPHHRLKRRRRRKWKSKTKRNLRKIRKSVLVSPRKIPTRKQNQSLIFWKILLAKQTVYSLQMLQQRPVKRITPQGPGWKTWTGAPHSSWQWLWATSPSLSQTLRKRLAPPRHPHPQWPPVQGQNSRTRAARGRRAQTRAPPVPPRRRATCQQ